VREVADTSPREHTVALDLTLVSSIDDVAQRMLVELARRLTIDGCRVILIDPESVVSETHLADAGSIDVVPRLLLASADEDRLTARM
jgi:glutaminase